MTAKYDRKLLVRENLGFLEATWKEMARDGWEIDPNGASLEIKDMLDGLMTKRIPSATLWLRKRIPGT